MSIKITMNHEKGRGRKTCEAEALFNLLGRTREIAMKAVNGCELG